ncbi:NAD(P)-dependent oxidoreductase [Arthrobacter sp. NPDC056691]|uniref:NAD(P)-dependent oxidoreductase n=1 Tax=Arthrobacter sp. NPDC056691 TaxID=3345913 RepID=UPI00366AA48E
MSHPVQIFVALGPVDEGTVVPLMGPNQKFIAHPNDDDLARANAAIVRAAYRIDGAVLDRMPELRVLARTGVGTDLVDVAEAERRGIPVVITPGSNTSSVAEGVFTHLLSLVKRLSELTSIVRGGRWNERDKILVGDLEGRTLGIVGYGRIGRRVEQIALAFGLRVLAYDPFAEIPEQIRRTNIDDLVQESDFVTLHIPLTKETAGMFNSDRLALGRPGSILINCSRGGLVDLDAALTALRSGQLGGLGLDVFDPEPPAHHPIFDHPRVCLSPHVMGFTQQSMANTVRDAVLGAQAVLDGRRPLAEARA